MPTSETLIASTAIRIDGRAGTRSHFICSGTVLSPNVVLTAGHCVTESEPLGSRRLLSPLDLTVYDPQGSFFGSDYDVAQVLVPDNYLKPAVDPDPGYDMALILLKSNLPSRYKFAVIATDFATAMKKDLYSAGFGAWTANIQSDDENDSGDLAFGSFALNSSDFSEANEVAYGVNRADSKTLKFRSTRNGPALCKGDSGGPIYYEENGTIHVVGVNVAIQFHNAADARAYRCANLNADELASSVFSENIHFIADGFQKLTGRPLPGIGTLRPAEDDPATLDFFLKNGDTAPRKNEWIDLSAVSTSVRDHHLMVYPRAIAQNQCLLVGSYVSLIQETFLESWDVLEPDSDGVAQVMLKRIIPQSDQPSLSQILSPNASVEKYFRGKIKIQNDSIVLAVLTPSGVVRAELPVARCF